MRTTVARHDGELGSRAMIGREPHPALAGSVTRYCGYEERTLAPMRRVEAPSEDVTVIVSLGPSIEVDGRVHTSFVAGMGDTHSCTEHDGYQRGVEINLAPLAARRLLGVPMHELSGRVVALEDVLGPAAADLAARLDGAPSWPARFELLDRVLARRLDEGGGEPPASVAWAWDRLRRSHGRAAIGALAADIGCSPRYLTLQFREHVGMPPKTLARVLRFQHALERLERDDGSGFAEIAEDCGYYDQAHLNRDFRAFAGAPPTDFLARRLPDGGGVAAERFASVQDAHAAAA
jgi:AraC-like DNA-binding protein